MNSEQNDLAERAIAIKECLAIILNENKNGYGCVRTTFDQGLAHSVEHDLAERIATELNISYIHNGKQFNGHIK
jgi:hypothetical protein